MNDQWTSAMLALGNIDLHNRPILKNSDGSISTVRSITIEDDWGRSVLLPTVGPNGEDWTPQQAIENYKQTGKNLGIFANETSANRYAEELHEAQAKERISLGIIRPSEVPFPCNLRHSR